MSNPCFEDTFIVHIISFQNSYNFIEISLHYIFLPVASNRNRYEMIIVASRKNLYEIVLDIKRLLSSLATVFEY